MPRKCSGVLLLLQSPAGWKAELSWAIWTPSKVAELMRSCGHFGTKLPIDFKLTWCGWAQSTHPCRVSYSSCSQTCLVITWRRGWLNLYVPAIHHSRPALAGSQADAQKWTFKQHRLCVDLTMGQVWDPLLCNLSHNYLQLLWTLHLISPSTESFVLQLNL